jgi:hypothetical protein
MWGPRRLTTVWAFTACYRDSFTFQNEYRFLLKVKMKPFLYVILLETFYDYYSINARDFTEFRRIYDRRAMKRQEVGENCIMRNFITCTLLQV